MKTVHEVCIPLTLHEIEILGIVLETEVAVNDEMDTETRKWKNDLKRIQRKLKKVSK